MTRWWMLPLSEAERLPEDLCRRLFPLRLARAERYLRHEDRLRCIGAGALLHALLGVKEAELCYGAFGKPFVPGGEAFSLSHGGSSVLLAADSQSIGTDAEVVDTRNLSAAEPVLTPSERQWISEMPAERFSVLWTLKESVLKLEGTGLSVSPASFSVLPLVLEGKQYRGGKWLYARSFVRDGTVYALCGESDVRRVSLTMVSARDCLEAYE